LASNFLTFGRKAGGSGLCSIREPAKCHGPRFSSRCCTEKLSHQDTRIRRTDPRPGRGLKRLPSRAAGNSRPRGTGRPGSSARWVCAVAAGRLGGASGGGHGVGGGGRLVGGARARENRARQSRRRYGSFSIWRRLAVDPVARRRRGSPAGRVGGHGFGGSAAWWRQARRRRGEAAARRRTQDWGTRSWVPPGFGGVP
jgi:hypothetical protein